MFDNAKKKLKDFKLRNIFRRKALPPIPKEIADNKPLQKAIIGRHRVKTAKKIGGVFLASAMLSTALQSNPDLVSQKFDDFMAARGYPDNLSQNYSTGEIRVYDRFNPLYPFHLAGREVSLVWQEGQDTSPIWLAYKTPFIYTGGLLKGFSDMIPTSQLDAYSMAPDNAPKDRVNFIRPPGEFSFNGFLADFAAQDGSNLTFKNDRDDLRKVLFEFVMLHEARHGDQEKLAYSNANEADADLYAFRVLQSRGTNPALLNEALTIVANARAINGAVRGDEMHASTFTLERGQERIFDAHEDAADFYRLNDLLREADARNMEAFPQTMPAGNRYFYLTLAMNDQGLLDEDPGLKKAAGAFIGAIRYFDETSGGKLVDPKLDLRKINLRYLTKEYHPVPDRLGVPLFKPSGTPAAAPRGPGA